MQELLSAVTSLAVELLVVIISTVALFVLNKVRDWLDKAKKKDELGILDIITDRVVEYAEAELKGAKGKEKRDFALKKAMKMLSDRGIHVSEDDVLAGIENGYNKVKNTKIYDSLSADSIVSENIAYLSDGKWSNTSVDDKR